MLDLASVQSGRMRWSLSAVDLPAVIETAVDSTHAIAAQNNLVVDVTLGDGLPTVTSDPDRLVQVITNLLSNAIKFTPSGGRIVVQARLAPIISPETGRAMVEISVSDNGIGIPADEFDNIFDRFQQVRTTLSDRPGGTGLGLAFSKEMVGRLGGSIWVKSEPEVGSTFLFNIPVEHTPNRPAG